VDIVPGMETSTTLGSAPVLTRRSAPRMGSIEVVCGPMFCGKSEELIRRLRRSTIARYAVVCVKPSIDDRHGVDDVISHAGSRIAARAIADPRELLELRGEADVIGIDEAQFFDSRLVGVCEDLAAFGLNVICAGLDRDYRGLPFGPMPELLSIADRVTKLQAVCVQCGGDATLSQRLVDGAPAPFDDATVVVGGAERYEARCRGCFERA
jgi:thymidine kinase